MGGENDRFRFALKLWRRFTHEREAAFTREEIDAVRAGLDPIAEAGRLGVVLLQFPWSFRNEEANREWLRDVANAFRAYPLAVEVRHVSWNDPAFYAELAERGMGFVNVDPPLFRNSIKPSARATSGIGYVRVHGRNYRDWFRKTAGRDERYDYLYTAKELEPWADRTRELADEPGVTDVRGEQQPLPRPGRRERRHAAVPGYGREGQGAASAVRHLLGSAATLR